MPIFRMKHDAYVFIYCLRILIYCFCLHVFILLELLNHSVKQVTYLKKSFSIVIIKILLNNALYMHAF